MIGGTGYWVQMYLDKMEDWLKENSSWIAEEATVAEETADEIKVGDWVESKDSGRKGKVWDIIGPEKDYVLDLQGYTLLYPHHAVRKLSLSELPPEAWDGLRGQRKDKVDLSKITVECSPLSQPVPETDKLTEDQTIGGSYKDYLNRHVEWSMNVAEENIREKLKGLGWKPPEESASSRQHGGNHYKKYPIQPYEYCFVNKLNNLQSEAISYITRYKDKGGKQDLEKAIHTLELLIEAEYDG